MARGGAGGRLAYADFLRVVAAFAVMMLHASGGWISEVSIGSAAWNSLNVWDGLVRFSVPLFIMLSGMFLLDPKKPLTLPHLFFKNILRVLVALFFWGAVYLLVHSFPGFGALDLNWLISAGKNVLWGNTHYHLWFLYMIIGLYLVTPILRAFVRGASRGDFHYFFLLVFVFAVLVPAILQMRPSQTLSTWVNRLNLHMVLGYVGYYVAGYYLKTYTLSRITEVIIYLLGILGAVVTIWGTSILSVRSGELNVLLYGNLTPNVAAVAVAVFVLARYLIGVSEEGARRWRIGAVAQVSFGMYLVHDLFFLVLKKLGLLRPAIGPALAVPLQAIFIFFCSFAVSWLLSKIPFVGKYIT